jgi:hypothetical protein
MAGAVASVVWTFMLTCVLALDAAFGLGGEGLVAPLLLLSALLLVASIEREWFGWRATFAVLGSGAFAGIATLSKQHAIVAIPAFFVASLLVYDRRPSANPESVPQSASWRKMLAFLFGLALPWCLVLGRYAAVRQLSSFRYWYWQYNTLSPRFPRTLRFNR